MKKMLSVLLAFTLMVALAACGGGGTSASSTIPPSSSLPSSESTPPQVSSVVVESEPEPDVDPTEETNTLLQSGLWGFDAPGDMLTYIAFRGSNEFTFFSAAWYPAEPYTSWGEYTIEGNTITATETGGGGFDGPTRARRTFVFELSDGALVQQSGGNGLFESQHTYTYQAYPPDVDYYGFSPFDDWKVGYAESGLRLRAAPNTDAEILREVNEQITQVDVIGVSQVDPAWRLICYGSTIGFAHGDYITME